MRPGAWLNGWLPMAENVNLATVWSGPLPGDSIAKS